MSVSRQRDFSNGSSRMHLWKVCHLMQGCGQQGLKGYRGLCFCSLERVSAQVSSVFVCLEDAPPFLAFPSLLSFLPEYDKALRRHFSRIITLSWWLDK